METKNKELGQEMKCIKDIKEMLARLEADERLSYPAANVQTNAPLALIQLSRETKISTLKWVLGEYKHLIVG